MRVGILGGGQLGRMLAQAAYDLGLDVRVFDPAPDACAGQLAEHIIAPFDDGSAIGRFCDGLDVATWEFENVPVSTARAVGIRVPIYPPVESLEITQDRLLEKQLFTDLGVPTVRYAPISSATDIQPAVNLVGLPAVLKTRRFGYDGKGQAIVRQISDIEPAWRALGGGACILEEWIDFDTEVSIIATRGRDDEIVHYPLARNTHRGGILRRTEAPAADVWSSLTFAAEDEVGKIQAQMGYVATIAVEFFVRDGQLFANEIAPRVHNSGHWSIEGSVTSQFENHIRAVCGFPLGSAQALGRFAMINLIGTVAPTPDLLRIDGARVHLYGKSPRPGRKLGHVTVQIDRPGGDVALSQLESLVGLSD